MGSDVNVISEEIGGCIKIIVNTSNQGLINLFVRFQNHDGSRNCTSLQYDISGPVHK